MDSPESLWVQYLALQEYPDAMRLFSHWTVGPGQISAGYERRRRLDCLVVERPGTFVMSNFHEDSHYRGHKDNCRLNEAVNFDPVGTRRNSDSELSSEEEEEVEEGGNRGVFRLTEKTAEGNSILRDYAEIMNEAVRKARLADQAYPRLEFKVRLDYECDFLHGKTFETSEGKKVRLKKWLKKKFPDSHVGFKMNPLTEKELLRRLLTSPSLGGFVVIKGGREKREDTTSSLMGFCLTKHQTKDVSELGKFALRLACQAGDLDPDKPSDRRKARQRLERACRTRRLTMCNKSFGDETHSTLSLQQLRFLVRERGLRDFSLVHYLHYDYR